MKKLFGRQRSNEDGSVLLAVLTIMTFAALLTATAFSFVRQASNQSFSNVNEKQAYYTASTCLETFVDSILTPGNPYWDDFMEVAESGGTSLPIDIEGMGTCAISVEKPSGMGYIKVVATAEVNGKKDSVACYLKANTIPKTADFSNAIELTGSGSAGYNNLNVIGDMAGSNNTNLDMVYSFDNQPTIYGTFFQYGTIENHNHLYFKDSVTGEGTSLTATEYINFSRNDTTIQSNIKKENNSNSNFVNAGKVFTTNATHTTLGADSAIDPSTGIKIADIDLFAGGVVFGLQNEASSNTAGSKLVARKYSYLSTNSGMQVNFGGGNGYVQYGNIYCYDNGSEMGGDMVVDSSSFKVDIKGDVFVEGDLYIATGAEFKVTGNLYVLGTITGTPQVSVDADRLTAGQLTGMIYCSSYGGANFSLDDATFQSIKTLRGATPTLEYEGTKYVYYPEDILLSSDANVSTISDKYKAVVTSPDTYSLSTYSGGTYDGVTFDKIVTGSCYIRQSDLNSYGGAMSILIRVTDASGDIVIVMEDGLNFMNGKKILVKNDTKVHETSKTMSPSFCYFTVDSYTSIAKVEPVYKTNPDGSYALDRNGNKQVIDSVHTGFKPSTSIQMNSEFCILDYDTWKNCNVGVSVAGKSCGTKYLNLSGVPDTTDSYDPGLGYIVYLFTEGTTVRANNQALFEGTFYARQATLDVNNGFNVNFYFGNASVDKNVTCDTFAIGSVIASTLLTRNAIYCAYCPPSSKSNLSNVGGSGAETAAGYEVLKYTKDLS